MTFEKPFRLRMEVSSKSFGHVLVYSNVCIILLLGKTSLVLLQKEYGVMTLHVVKSLV